LNPWLDTDVILKQLTVLWPGKVEQTEWLEGFVALYLNKHDKVLDEEHLDEETKQGDERQEGEMKKELDNVNPVPRIHDLEPVKMGAAWPMDAASGYAVRLLGVEPGDHVLDLCCCPGNKLLAIADAVRLQGSVTGVDISSDRLNVCRKLLQKHCQSSEEIKQHLDNFSLRLYCADGQTFNILPPLNDPEVAQDAKINPSGKKKRDLVYHSKVNTLMQVTTRKRKRVNKSARAREARLLQQIACEDLELEESSIQDLKFDTTTGRKQQVPLYDKVLVDAECTHDGSYRHMEKLMTVQSQDEMNNFFSLERAQKTCLLQKSLIENGFRLLRPGGNLVYSTCSLSPLQNEYVVHHLLKTELSAKLCPTGISSPLEDFEYTKQQGQKRSSVTDSGSTIIQDERLNENILSQEIQQITNQTRYFNSDSHTSGLYVAKITKEDINAEL